MELEYPREAQRPQTAVKADSEAVSKDFVAGLQTMSTEFDELVENFAWCAGQLLGDRDADARILGMIEFAVVYKQFGIDTAVQAVVDNSGVLVEARISRTSEIREPAVIIGFTDARYGPNGERLFDGVGMVKDRKGREALVAVEITPKGRTTIKPADEQIDEPETKRFMKELGRK